MKKIYMFLAAMTLLSLSLNAQLLPSVQKTLISNNKSFREVPASFKDSNVMTGKSMMSKAPLKANLGEGEYILGPYTSDAYNSTGWGLTNVTTLSSGTAMMVGVDLSLSEYQDYLGDEIVGYRFATIGEAYIYDVFIFPMSENYLSSDNMIQWNLYDDEGYPQVFSTTGWHEFRLDTPIELSFPDSIQSFWLGYEYYQFGSSQNYNRTPVAYNSNSTSHLDRFYWPNQGFYDLQSYIGGDIAIQLIMKSTDATPALTSPVDGSTVNVGINNGSGVSKTVTIKGRNLTQDLTVSVSGAGFSVSRDVTVTAAEANAGKDVTVTYNGTATNATGTMTISSSEVNATVNLTASYSEEVVICDGTDQNEFLPIYGYWYDSRQINQMIYPAGELNSLVGKEITSMTFYSPHLYFSAGKYTVKVGITSQTTFTSPITRLTANSISVSELKTVAADLVATAGGTELTINFNEPLSYSGGNLLVDFEVTATGNYGSNHTFFYGKNQSSSTGFYSRGSSTNSYGVYGTSALQQFLPKVSFTVLETANPTIEITPATQTINDAAAGTLTVTGTDIEGNINVSAANNDWYLNPTSLANTGGDVNVTYTGRELSASTTVTASATGATDATATVNYVADVYIVGNFGNSGWDFEHGTQMSYNNGTYTTTLTASSGDFILFARLLGNDNPWNTRDVFGPVSGGDWWMQGDSNGGNLNLYGSNCIYFPEGGTYRITINANDNTFTITKLSGEQTAQPVITSSSDGEYVTITATGNGTVTLNVPGQDPVSGEGEVSITVPCGVVSNTITVSATAKEDGKEESDPATAQITIPAGSDWVEMTGTYNNPNDLLSFQVKVGNDTIDIMLIDQFRVSTLKNDHPDHYTYTLRQTINGETQTSTPVSIPVYKTNSTMQGLYTYNQVTTEDKNMSLKANVFNTEMDYMVNPDRNVQYYSLYRGEKNTTYPLITVPQRISQLQKFDEMISEDNVQYYLFESHPLGIVPRYVQADHIGSQIVERLDTNWVEGTIDDMLPYVPVIWTNGQFSARGDGKDNSYGSDIKREYMGKVDAVITGQISQGDFGTWEANGVEYRAFHPTIVATGYLPQGVNNYHVYYNDEDVATYVPYLCRAWCTNEGIHDYGRDGDGNLMDLGELQTPFLLGEATFGTDMTATIGGDWTHGSERDPWSFALPATVAQQDVTFIVRFYYKKVVTEAQQEGGNGKFIGGEAEEYFIAQTEGDADDMIVAINELMNGIVPVSVTYVNPQGMQSSRPFDGVNIVVTRYSDGTTRTSKIIR